VISKVITILVLRPTGQKQIILVMLLAAYLLASTKK